MNHQTILEETRESMANTVEYTLHELSTLHTGKASPSMVENLAVQIESYGGTTLQLKEIAAITTPDARTVQIQPWDKSLLRDIEKAIQTANLGFNPTTTGDIVRIPIPELSGDRRKELVKVAHTIVEEGRIKIRHSRRDALDALKKMQKRGDISEDDLKRYEKEVQNETDKHIDEIGNHLERKEKELKTV